MFSNLKKLKVKHLPQKTLPTAAFCPSSSNHVSLEHPLEVFLDFGVLKLEYCSPLSKSSADRQQTEDLSGTQTYINLDE